MEETRHKYKVSRKMDPIEIGHKDVNWIEMTQSQMQTECFHEHCTELSSSREAGK